MNGIKVWVSDKGEIFRIPAEFSGVRMTRSGWPDKRTKDYQPFMEWVNNATRKGADNGNRTESPDNPSRGVPGQRSQ